MRSLVHLLQIASPALPIGGYSYSQGLEWMVETRDVRFHCPCSQASVLGSLATLDVKDIQSFIDDGEILDIACDYCGADYQVAPDQLRGLLQSS